MEDRGWRDRLGLAAVFEQEELCARFLGEVKADRAVAGDQVARDAATGAHAVDLVNAYMRADVEFAPRFDKNGALRFVGEEELQGGARVFHIGHPRLLLDDAIIHAG